MRHRLETHVRALAVDIGERHVRRSAALDAAAEYVKAHLPGVAEQTFECEGITVRNLEWEQPGHSKEIVVVGAHYDTVPGTPGANDNATGVAAVLALVESFRRLTPNRTIRWVLFVNEEPPYFQSEQMGSYVYANLCHNRGDNIHGMISLETIGFYSDEPGSQTYPFPRGDYPDRGDFIGLVSDLQSRNLAARVQRDIPSRYKLPVRDALRAGVNPGRGVVGSLVFLAVRLSRTHGDRYGSVAVPALSRRNRYARPDRLRPFHGGGQRRRRSASLARQPSPIWPPLEFRLTLQLGLNPSAG